MPSKIAAQLYTVRDFTKTRADFDETLSKVADIGYPAVQISAVGCMNGEDPEVSPAQAREMLDAHGLKCCATHRQLADFDDIDGEIEFHQTLGCDYAAIGSIPGHMRNLAGYRSLVEQVDAMLPRLQKAGLRWGYHNHAFEFRREQGRRHYDILLEDAPGALNLEIDTYWVAFAGASPVVMLKKAAGRIPVVHVKDLGMGDDNKPMMTPVGEGNLDWDGIVEACEAGGTEWYCVEQDNCYDRDPFDCLQSSFDFLSAKGL